MVLIEGETRRSPICKTWIIPSQLGAEKTIRAEIEKIATACGVSEDRKEDMCTAVAEACINAIEHGNLGRTDLDVSVKLCVHQESFVFRIYDSGLGLANSSYAQTEGDGATDSPTFDPKSRWQAELPRGWGLFLMNKLADRVSSGFDTDGHYYKLEFRRKGPQDNH